MNAFTKGITAGLACGLLIFVFGFLTARLPAFQPAQPDIVVPRFEIVIEGTVSTGKTVTQVYDYQAESVIPKVAERQAHEYASGIADTFTGGATVLSVERIE